jgi:hypothetical protein
MAMITMVAKIIVAMVTPVCWELCRIIHAPYHRLSEEARSLGMTTHFHHEDPNA